MLTEEELAATEKFCDEYALLGGIDPENVYRLHLGSEQQCGVTISGLRALVAEVRSLRTQRDALAGDFGRMSQSVHFLAGHHRTWDECEAAFCIAGRDANASLAHPDPGESGGQQ